MSAKILIVEDDGPTREGLAELLQRSGYATYPASTFHEAREALERESPDLLIADLRLDGFNGLQLVAVNPRPLPSIIISGHPDPVLAEDARRLGAEFLLKPFAPATLLDLIARKLAGGASVDGSSYEQTRRWARKPLAIAWAARVADRPVRVVDISYGGLRFEMEADPAAAGPRSLRLVLPQPNVAIDVDVVWASRAEPHRWLCGAAVSNDGDPQWRRLVDSTI